VIANPGLNRSAASLIAAVTRRTLAGATGRILALTRFPDANPPPSRIKSGAGFRRKTLTGAGSPC
jgi:hypothetical protein